MPTVCVYSIMRNEARHVERWHASAKEADHLLLLDTGSVDRSVMIAESLGIEVHRAVFQPWRFDDARNASLALIHPEIDIVLPLDLDEVLEPGWRQAIDGVNENHRRWSYMLRSDPSQSASWGTTPRSNCHRRFGFRWHHPVHEVIGGPAVDAHLDLTITHLPNLDKQRNYLKPLERAVAWEPNSARMRFYLGREQRAFGQWEQARETLWHYLQMSEATWSAERSEAYLILAEMDRMPERWLWRAAAECPERREPWAMLAYHFVKVKDWHQAQMCYGLAQRRRDTTIYITKRDCWDREFLLLGERIRRRGRPT